MLCVEVGFENPRHRANDDGEPYNSAGLPIYKQIQSFDVTDVLVTVVRIFGGAKLGVGGLINAYKTTAQIALENSKITVKTLKQKLTVSFKYSEMDEVMRVIKKYQLEIESQHLTMDCEITLLIRKNDIKKILLVFDRMYKVKTKIVNV